MINKMSDWVSKVLQSADPDIAIHSNEKIASNLLYRVLLAWWLVYRSGHGATQWERARRPYAHLTLISDTAVPPHQR